jgi:hypothetical protein
MAGQHSKGNSAPQAIVAMTIAQISTCGVSARARRLAAMKSIEVARVKSEKMYQELFDSLKMEANKTIVQANKTGNVFSGKLGAQLRVLCLSKMKSLQEGMVKIYVETLGHDLDQSGARTVISQSVGAFFEECKKTYFGPEHKRPAHNQNVAAFEEGAKQLNHQLDQDLQIAVHEAKKTVPRFWESKRHDIWLVLITSALSIAGALIVQWFLKKLNLKN